MAEAQRRRPPAWEVALLFVCVAAWGMLWFALNRMEGVRPGPAEHALAYMPRAPLAAWIALATFLLPPVVAGCVALRRLVLTPNLLPALRTPPPMLVAQAGAALWAYVLPSAAAVALTGRSTGNLGLLTIAGVAGLVLAYGIAALALAPRDGALRGLGWGTRGSARWAAIGYASLIPLMVASFAIAAALIAAFPGIQTPANPAAEWAVTARGWRLALVAIIACLIAPATEELVFRGLLYRGLAQRYGTAIGAIAGAAVFAGMHPQLPLGFPPLFAIGVALCLVYRASGSLVPCIAIHALNNAVALLLTRTALGGVG